MVLIPFLTEQIKFDQIILPEKKASVGPILQALVPWMTVDIEGHYKNRLKVLL